MGYTEILQMVNSDPSVSLNEKMEYIGGVIPRGCKSRTVTSDTPRKEVVLCEVSGTGFVYSAEIALQSYWNTLAKAALYIYCDEKLSAKIEHEHTSSSNQSVNKKGFIYSTDEIFSVDPLEVTGADQKTNKIVSFKRKLKIVYKSESGASISGSSFAKDVATVVYGLID